MAKHKDEQLSRALFARLRQVCLDAAPADLQREPTPKELRKMKKFRFQLLHRWLLEHFEPCRVGDVAGGKGLLTHLLQEDGWQAVVIDPLEQPLPVKYKDLDAGQRVMIPAGARVPRLNRRFEASMGQDFDLLVGLHAHGCNVAIIQAAARFGCGFVLFPCCIIDEPFVPPAGVHWLESLAGYALHLGLPVFPFRLNFRGQNIGLCTPGRALLKRIPAG
jgi:hypothetical protein